VRINQSNRGEKSAFGSFHSVALPHLSQQGEVAAAFKARDRLALVASPVMGRKWLQFAGSFPPSAV